MEYQINPYTGSYEPCQLTPSDHPLDKAGLGGSLSLGLIKGVFFIRDAIHSAEVHNGAKYTALTILALTTISLLTPVLAMEILVRFAAFIASTPLMLTPIFSGSSDADDALFSISATLAAHFVINLFLTTIPFVLAADLLSSEPNTDFYTFIEAEHPYKKLFGYIRFYT